MSREVKFRGKRLDAGEWVYGSLVQKLHATYIHWYHDEIAELSMVDPKTVGQYTGLKDKHGGIIYEGDLVLWVDKRLVDDDQEFRYVVEVSEYLQTTRRLVFASHNYDPTGMKYRYSPHSVVDSHTDVSLAHLMNGEVIGNIYENPELLETA